MNNPIITNEMLDWARAPDNIRDNRTACHDIFADAKTERNAANQPYHVAGNKPVSVKVFVDNLVFDQGYNTFQRRGAYARLLCYLEPPRKTHYKVYQFNRSDKIGKQYAKMVCRRLAEDN